MLYTVSPGEMGGMRYCQQPMMPPGKTDQQKGEPLEMLRNQENQLGTEMAEKTILTAPCACSVLLAAQH